VLYFKALPQHFPLRSDKNTNVSTGLADFREFEQISSSNLGMSDTEKTAALLPSATVWSLVLTFKSLLMK
jgi:hypothetical protein